MSIVSFTKTSPVTFVALVFVGVVLTSYGVALYFLHQLSTLVEEEQQNVATIRAEEEARITLLRQADQIVHDHTTLNTYLVDDSAVVAFLESIESLGHGNGVEVTTASIDVAKDGDFTEELRLTVKVSGPYEGVRHVLELLETLPYASYAESAEMTRKGEAANLEWEGTYKVVVAKHEKI